MHLCSLTCKLKTWQTVPASLCCTCLSPQDGALVLLMLTDSLWEDNLLQEDLKEGSASKTVVLFEFQNIFTEVKQNQAILPLKVLSCNIKILISFKKC